MTILDCYGYRIGPTRVSGSIGFLDTRNMGIDSRITVLGASKAKIYEITVFNGGHFEF